MNAPILAGTVMSLGIMMGITATHYQHVDHLVKHGVPSDVPAPRLETESRGPGKEGTMLAKAVSVKSQVQPRSSKSVIRQRAASMDFNVSRSDGNAREDVLLEILAAMRDEQKAIRQQLSESNRDIDELTFRVDTHSDSFKPLHSTEVDRPQTLRNRDALHGAGAVGTGLLPPKQ